MQIEAGMQPPMSYNVYKIPALQPEQFHARYLPRENKNMFTRKTIQNVHRSLIHTTAKIWQIAQIATNRKMDKQKFIHIIKHYSLI